MGCQEASCKSSSSFFLPLCSREQDCFQQGGKCLEAGRSSRASGDGRLAGVEAAGGPADPCGSWHTPPHPVPCTAYILSLQNSISGEGKWGGSQFTARSFPHCIHSSLGCLSRPGFPARPFCCASTLTTRLFQAPDPSGREGAPSLSSARLPPANRLPRHSLFPMPFGTEVNSVHIKGHQMRLGGVSVVVTGAGEKDV